MRIALAQILSGADPEANLGQVADQTATAARDGADLVVFPEATMRCFGRSLRDVAEPLDGPWATRLADIAEQHSVVIAAGMFTPSGDGRVRNTVRLVGPGLDEHYDKIHLFDAFGFTESETVAPGDELLVVRIGGVGVGVATCYDIRFPGLFVTLAERGAEVICVPTSWGAGPGKVDQWQVLLRARALDCTCYVAAAAQADPTTVGLTSGSAPTGIGYSGLAGPDGSLLATLGPEPGLLLVDIDPDAVAATRKTIPVLANRRFS